MSNIKLPEADADGWMQWSGVGASPVPLDQLVEYRLRSGETYTDPAGALFWPHTVDGHDIIAFRLAPTAPVEASGSEQLKARATHGEYSLHNFPDDPDADHSVWSIFHTTESGGLEVASGMDRATADLLLAALRPQPSGETREALDRLKMAAHVYEDDEMAADCATLEALLSARPLALGGQQGDSETLRVLLDNLVIAQTMSKDIRQKATDEARSYLYDLRHTPARAEAQDEGAAGEPVAWRDVVGFEGLYEVSSDGDVRNAKTGRVQAKNLMGLGYVKAELWRDGVRKQTSVHRVVAEAFLPRVAGFDEVNHIDGNKQNNTASNLEWSDRKSNTDHSRYVLGNDVKAVLAIDPEDGSEEYYPSIEEAGRSGYKASGVYAALNGIKKTHGGKRWVLTEWRNPAHPSPTPAADAGVLLPEVMTEEMERVWRGAFIHQGHKRHGRGAIGNSRRLKSPESCEQYAWRALRKHLLAALKSTAAKEGGA